MTQKVKPVLENETEEMLSYLGLRYLGEHWGAVLNAAKEHSPTYHSFLTDIIKNETADRKERQRKSRISRANIQEVLVMETFPFVKQPNLKKNFVLELYESMEYMLRPQDLVLIGPTGCGKTGLATSYLIQALNKGYRGYFIDFKELLDELLRAVGDQTEKKLVKKFAAYDVLVIDELGHSPIRKEQAGLFFNLMRQRHKKKTTFITTQLGYDEWGDFLQNKHLTAAMLDRMTENCTVFNMRKCISIRPKNVKFGTTDESADTKKP